MVVHLLGVILCLGSELLRIGLMGSYLLVVNCVKMVMVLKTLNFSECGKKTTVTLDKV